MVAESCCEVPGEEGTIQKLGCRPAAYATKQAPKKKGITGFTLNLFLQQVEQVKYPL